MLPKTTNTLGFTLIELLVVITIIAILSVIGLVVYSGISARARDTKRMAEIDSIQKAMEKKYQPGSTTPYKPLAIDDFVNNVVPTDPRSTEAKCGAPTAGGQNKTCVYCFYPKGTTQAEDIGTTAGTCGTMSAVGGSLAASGVPTASSGYVVCANLETPAGFNGAYYYCKANAQ